jgi:hypothetical protein
MSSLTTIAQAREKCKNLVRNVPRDVIIIAVLVLASSLSFGLGYLTGSDARAQEGSDISVERVPIETSSHVSVTAVPLPAQTSSTTGQVVASKNGTKYYLPGCAGANRISAANKVAFASVAAAKAAGYGPAANCKGL